MSKSKPEASNETKVSTKPATVTVCLFAEGACITYLDSKKNTSANTLVQRTTTPPPRQATPPPMWR